jgi:hypothetical protein
VQPKGFPIQKERKEDFTLNVRCPLEGGRSEQGSKTLKF